MKKKLTTNTFRVAFIVNLIFFLAVYQIFEVSYQTNDDVGMMLMTGGVTRVIEPTPYILFTNYIIASTLNELYSFSLSVPWYTLYLIGTLFIAHVTLFYVSLKNLPSYITVVGYLSYLMTIGLILLTELQFTISSIMISLAGLSLIVLCNRAKKNKISKAKHFSFLQWIDKYSIIGWCMFTTGLMIRMQAALLAIGIFVPIIFIHLYRKRINLILGYCFLLGVALMMSFVVYQIDKYAYSTNEKWEAYQEFNLLRAEFVDNIALNRIPIEEQRQLLIKAGWTSNDYNMLMNWFYMNENIYNTEKFKQILSELPSIQSQLNVKDVFNVFYSIFSTNMFFNSSILFLLGLLLLKFKGRVWLIPIFAVIAVMGILIIITLYMKVPPERIYYALFAFLSIVPFLVSTSKSSYVFDTIPVMRKCFLVILIIGFVFAGINTGINVKKKSEQNEHKQLILKELVSHVDHAHYKLYVSWGQGFPWRFIDPFSDVGFLKNLNVFALGTMELAPHAQDMLDKHRVDDLYLALVENPNVFMIVHNLQLYRLDLYIRYMKEHYRMDVTPVKHLQSPVFEIYKFSVNK